MTLRFAPLLAALLAAFSLPALADKAAPAAAAAHAGHHAAAAQLTDGVVKKVDKAAGRLTLSHGPLPNGMPAMTMAFRVKDPAWLEPLKVGDKVRFAVEEGDAGLIVVQLERP